jgi:hypothetical protein
LPAAAHIQAVEVGFAAAGMLADHRDLQGFEGQAELLPFPFISPFALIGSEQGDWQYKREGKQC